MGAPFSMELSGDHPRYPQPLKSLKQPPKKLWVMGTTPDPARPSLAMVGARAASGAGVERTFAWAEGLAREGFQILSGGALGIDAAAHRGALAAGGSTFAVLGCGVDVVYPDRHGPLFAEITQQGGLLSEFPLGTKPRAGHFPSRNRLVAALGQGLLLMECQGRSGALNTVAWARKLGRRVWAFPGTPGPDRLIQRGEAEPVTSLWDVLRPKEAMQKTSLKRDSRPAPLVPLLDALQGEPLGAPELARRLDLSLPAVLALLLEAELDGWVCRMAGGLYEVPRA